MKKKRFSDEQIVKILSESESTSSVREVSRKYGICEQTIYRWRKKFGGMGVDSVRELRKLRDENTRLKQIVADQALDIRMLEDVNTKKW
jgi:putative transposase